MVRKTKRRNKRYLTSKIKPKTIKVKNTMFKKCGKKCGKKCLLFYNMKFPICKVNTYSIDKRGIWAEYISAKNS